MCLSMPGVARELSRFFYGIEPFDVAAVFKAPVSRWLWTGLPSSNGESVFTNTSLQ